MLKGYRSLDGQIHSKRIGQFHKAIQLGQFPPRLAPDLFGSIGYPLFIVNYQLPYYLAEPFMFVKNDPMLAYKIVMSTSHILGGIFAFILFRNIGSNWASLAGAVIFTYLPYRFGNLYMRGAFGESVSLMFVPLILLSAHLITKDQRKGVFLLALATFGFISSHTLTVPIFVPIITLYIFLILRPSQKKLMTIFLGVIWGLLLSSFQLIPSILEKKYMVFDQKFLNLYHDFFINFYQLFRIPMPEVNVGTYLQVGIVSTFIIATSTVIFLVKPSRFLAFFLFFSSISIFLTHSSSSWFWDNFPILKYTTYPYRFLSLTILSTAFLAVYVADKINEVFLRINLKNSFAVFLILVTFYTNRHFFLTNAPWFAIPPPPSLTTQNESDPIWSNEKTFIDRPLITSSSPIKITSLNQSPFSLSFETQVVNQTTIVVRKLYFPGWRLKISGENRQISIKDGLISFDLEPGTSYIEAYFDKTPIRQVADLTSLAGFLALIVIFLGKQFSQP